MPQGTRYSVFHSRTSVIVLITGLDAAETNPGSKIIVSANRLYKIASVLMVLFTLGHTYGFLNFMPPTPEGRAVLDSMNHVYFQVKGATFSYGGFYRGFGLAISVDGLFKALVTWHLGTLAGSNPQAIGLLGWGLVVVHIAMLILSLRFFAIAPAVANGLLVILLAAATWSASRQGIGSAVSAHH
jgi:hypothetical protein